jgi:hypothetical protein
MFSVKFIDFLKSIPYLKRFQAFGAANLSLQKNSKTINENARKDYSNKNNFFMANPEKKGDKVLHIRDSWTGLRFTPIFDQM